MSKRRDFVSPSPQFRVTTSGQRSRMHHHGLGCLSLVWTNSSKLQNTSMHNVPGITLAFANILPQGYEAWNAGLYQNCCLIKNTFAVFFHADIKVCSVHIKSLQRIPFGLYYQEINRGFTSLRHCKGKDSKHYMRYGSFCPINVKWETSLLCKTAVVWFYWINRKKKEIYFLWNKRMVCKACNTIHVSEY